MFFNDRIIITYNCFPSRCQYFQVFTDSDLEMMFSLAIIDSIAASTMKFENSGRMLEFALCTFSFESVLCPLFFVLSAFGRYSK